MQASNMWMTSTGMPSFFHSRTETWRNTWGIRTAQVSQRKLLCQKGQTVLVGKRYLSSRVLFALCSRPKIEKPSFLL